MEKQQDIMCHSKDSLISRATKSDSFNWPSLCHLSPFHLPYVKAGHVACQNFTLIGLLTLRSHFKLSRAMNCVWPQHLFSKPTNHKLCKKLPNQKCHKDNYMEFEHNTVHKFADTLYRWFRVSAM